MFSEENDSVSQHVGGKHAFIVKKTQHQLLSYVAIPHLKNFRRTKCVNVTTSILTSVM